MGDYGSPCWYDDQVSFMQELESPNQVSSHHYASYQQQQHYPCKQELEMQYNLTRTHDAFLQLPQLESPKLLQSYGYDHGNNNNGSTLQSSSSSLPQQEEHIQHGQHQSLQHLLYGSNNDQVTDWRVLDKFVASQLSHEQHASKDETSYSNVAEDQEQFTLLPNGSEKPEINQKYASTTTSSCQIDPWK